MVDTSELRKIAEAATLGPWGWFGSYDEWYLSTLDRGRIYVMGFKRKGMQGAEPMFQVRDDPDHPTWGHMVGATELAIPRAPYDPHSYVGIDNPDARYIKMMSPDVVLSLLDEIDRLREKNG